MRTDFNKNLQLQLPQPEREEGSFINFFVANARKTKTKIMLTAAPPIAASVSKLMLVAAAEGVSEGVDEG